MANDTQSVPTFQLHKISYRVRFLIAFVLGPLFNWSPTKIRDGLKQWGVRLLPSLKAICLFGKRYRTSHSLADGHRSGRPSKLKVAHGDALDHWIRCNQDITMAELQQRMLDVFRIQVSSECIRMHVRKLGWCKKQTRYCQMVRRENQVKRLTYCLMCYSNNEEFQDCILSDEASIEVMRSGRMRFIHKEEKTIIAKVWKPKHPFKVHVWAGISY
ncbi:uncharacterized protein LOC135472697 [Liolophura sinensis]|uniref:uncharacterized protein LOC135472697 n=1 Tax=Liolophura sinensis TaxID=3198878 RepID=UPI00315917E7